jgi:hypothetical protein
MNKQNWAIVWFDPFDPFDFDFDFDPLTVKVFLRFTQ